MPIKSRRYRKTLKSRGTRKHRASQKGGMHNSIRLIEPKDVKQSWKDGSNAWIVRAPGEGIRMFMKDNFENENELVKELKPYLANKKTMRAKDYKYDVRGN